MTNFAKTLRRAALGAFLLLPIAAASTAGVPAHVTAPGTVSPSTVSVGGKGVLTVRLTIASGFHINSEKPLQPYLVPTTLDIGGMKGLKLGHPIFPVPVTITEGTDKLPAYANTTVVKVPFTVQPGAHTGKVYGSLNYQACTSESCFPPTTAKFSVAITVK